jgi:hypothetical protein
VRPAAGLALLIALVFVGVGCAFTDDPEERRSALTDPELPRCGA